MPIFSISYALGYLKRPYLWKDLCRQPWRLIQLQRRREKCSKQLYKWLDDRSLFTSEAISKICNSQGKFESILDNMPMDAIENAKKREKQIPCNLGGAANLDLLYSLVKWFQPNKVVETGVASGWSSLAILLALNERQSMLYSIDRPDMSLPSDAFVGYVVPDTLKKHWHLKLGSDRDQIPKVLHREKEGFDMVHYDSDKSYYGRIWAYKVLWQALNKDGFLISDDIENNSAFKDFCHKQVYQSLYIIKCPKENESSCKFVGIIQK